MVATKSKKTTKYTYTERVLGAFTRVQKDHKKHAVHLASLRAQVRKTAQAKKDKLGPQWSNWVGKAVHKLEDEGVLISSEPLGTVALTPNGKKAIQAARRSLAISPYASPSSTQEDIIWKQVVNQFAGRGLKRKQPSRQKPSAVEESEGEESDEEEEVLSTLKKRNTRSKRPRTSAVKKPISKMTKAELKDELKALQGTYAATSSTPKQGLRSAELIDVEETRQLREELKSRQDEINIIRNELVHVKKRLNFVDEVQDQNDQDGSSRLTTPETTTDFASSPTRPHLPNVLARSRSSLGLIRTQSGSLIPDISKQPTPAPSSPGLDGDDVFGDSGLILHNDADVALDRFATPTVTPTRLPAQTELAKELEKYRCLVETMEDHERVSHSKVESLELALSARSIELQNLQKTMLQLQSEYAETEQTLSRRDLEVVDLQTTIEVLKQRLAEGTAAMTLKDARISELDVANTGIQCELASKNEKLAELDSVIQEHLSLLGQGDKIANLVTQMSSLGQVLRDAVDAREFAAVEAANAQTVPLTAAQELRAQLDAERSINTTQLNKLEIAEADKVSLSIQVAAAAGRQAQAEVALEEARESVRALGAQLMGSDEVLGEARVANAELKKQVTQSQQEVEMLRAQIVSLQTSIDSINSQLVSSTNAVEELNTKLTNETEHTRQLASELKMKEENALELAATKAEALSDVASLTAQLQVANGAFATFESERDTLGAELVKARKELDRLMLDCTVKDGRQKELEEKIALTEALRDRLLDDLAHQQNEIRDLRSLLDSAEGKTQNLKASMETAETRWKASVNDFESTIATLQNTLLSSQTDVDVLRSQVDALVADMGATQSRLNETHSQYTSAQEALEVERQRARALEEKWVESAARVQEDAEEIAELKSSKEADAATIENLKNVFMRLQKAQMLSLAEVENEVASAQSSPAPKNRYSLRMFTEA